MNVNVYSDIFAVASLKTDSIDMEIIERSKEKKRQREVNDLKDLNKMRWFQTLPNGTGFCWGIRRLSLVGNTIVRPSVVYETYEIESHILTNAATESIDYVIIYVEATLQWVKVSIATLLMTFYCYSASDDRKCIYYC